MHTQRDLEPCVHSPSGFTNTTKQRSKVNAWREPFHSKGNRAEKNQRWLSSLSSAALQLSSLAWGYCAWHFSVNLWLIVKMISKLTHSEFILKNTSLISIERNIRTSTFFTWSHHDIRFCLWECPKRLWNIRKQCFAELTNWFYITNKLINLSVFTRCKTKAKCAEDSFAALAFMEKWR